MKTLNFFILFTGGESMFVTANSPTTTQQKAAQLKPNNKIIGILFA